MRGGKEKRARDKEGNEREQRNFRDKGRDEARRRGEVREEKGKNRK